MTGHILADVVQGAMTIAQGAIVSIWAPCARCREGSQVTGHTRLAQQSGKQSMLFATPK